MSWEDETPLPCPFCAAYQKEKHIELADTLIGWHIYCKFCGARGPNSIELQNAVMKWNRRGYERI